jgi:hypothetical protein
VKRLEWAGHIVRVSENRTIKKVFNTKPEGSGKAGRPRLRREDCVGQDIRIFGVKTEGVWQRIEKNGQQF